MPTRLPLVFAALLAATAGPAAAQGVFVPPPGQSSGPSSEGLIGVRAHVQNQLPIWGYPGVDVRNLTLSQVATINSVIHSGRSEVDVRAKIGQIIRRGGLLQRGIVDPLTGRS